VKTHVANEKQLLGSLTASERRTLDDLLKRLLIPLERANPNL
jgi:hypothetical protein